MNSKVHHGYNIRRVRMEKNIKQELLSEKVHMSQPTVIGRIAHSIKD